MGLQAVSRTTESSPPAQGSLRYWSQILRPLGSALLQARLSKLSDMQDLISSSLRTWVTSSERVSSWSYLGHNALGMIESVEELSSSLFRLMDLY